MASRFIKKNQEKNTDRAVSYDQLKFSIFDQVIFHLCMVLIVVMALFGITRRVHAEIIDDVPAKISITSVANAAFSAMGNHPEVFDTQEQRSNDLSAFTKWIDMFDRFEQEIMNGKGQQELQLWRVELTKLQSDSIEEMARGVNDLVNKVKYVNDTRNWGKSDYWATPIEFLTRGAGDCEDFAITKYTALRALGVPEERLRMAIVHDNVKNIPHAILIVYTENGPFILDNQIKTLIDGSHAGRYRPIYSINRYSWWLHTARPDTRIASSY